LTNKPDSLIIRTSWLFGKDQKQLNFAMFVKNKLSNNEKITTAVNQFGTPTYADDLAKNSIYLASKDSKGIFHISSSRVIISKYLWANYLSSLFELDNKLISYSNFNNSYRPERAGLKSYFSLNLIKNLIDQNP